MYSSGDSQESSMPCKSCVLQLPVAVFKGSMQLKFVASIQNTAVVTSAQERIGE